MKKIIFALLVLISSLYAELKNEYLSQKLLDSNIPIVDIRTTGEWKETGVIENSIPVMFFDEQGRYDVTSFLKELNEKVDTSKPFAIVCRTGHRTKMVSKFLSEQMHYKVTNILGGITSPHMKKLPFVKYEK